MTKHTKLLSRFLSKPKDFDYSELKKLLAGFGYTESNLGKTSGSRVGFVNMENGNIIRLHKPHPDNTLKIYQVEQIIDYLKQKGLI
jgi:hypothetical protein